MRGLPAGQEFGFERSSVVGRRSAVGGRRSSVGGRRSSVVGRRSSVVGRRSSGLGRRSSGLGSFELLEWLLEGVEGDAAGGEGGVAEVGVGGEEGFEFSADGVAFGEVGGEVAVWFGSSSLLGDVEVFDFVLEHHEALQQGLGAGWAAGDVDIDGDDEVDAGEDGVAVGEGAAHGCAAAHGDDPAGF